MTPLYTIARDIDDALGGTACADAIEASTADLSRVVWRFLAAVMREMKPGPAEVQAVIDPVIAGLDRLGRGEDWPKADARAASWAAETVPSARDGRRRTWWAAGVAVMAARAARARPLFAADASWAAEHAARADVPRARQRDIFLRLIQEARE
jgi:hypothetical protein